MNLNSQHLNRPIRVLDLFAGAGGLSLGLESIARADGKPAFEVVAAVDKSSAACNTLRKHFRESGRTDDRVLQADLTNPVDQSRIVDLCWQKGGVELIVGGPPCQSFSTIGPRSGYGTKGTQWLNDERDQLYENYVHLVSQLGPTFILFENVSGLLSKRNPDGRLFIDIIIGHLQHCSQQSGYTLDFVGDNGQYLLLNAADFGVPQIRHRVFIIGNKLGISNSVPVQTHYDPESPPLHSGKMLPWVTLCEAIGDLPFIRAPYTMTGLTPEEAEKYKRINLRRNSGQEDTEYHSERFDTHYHKCSRQGQLFLDWVRSRKGSEARLIGHVARGQQVSDQELFAGMKPGKTSSDLLKRSDPLLSKIKYDMSSFKDKYRKQAWNRPSTTIFAHMVRDGNRFIHPNGRQARTLTVREAARIQSFPDDFEVEATGLRRFTYIGNAVPPLMARALGKSILDTLERADSLWTENSET